MTQVTRKEHRGYEKKPRVQKGNIDRGYEKEHWGYEREHRGVILDFPKKCSPETSQRKS